MPKIGDVKYEGPKKTVQSKFTDETVKEKLKGIFQNLELEKRDG